MKKVFVLFIAFTIGFGLIATSSFAQEEEESAFSVGADLVSSYLWRGQYLGGVNIQPAFNLSLGNFSAGAWGSSSFEGAGNSMMELDLNVSYYVMDAAYITVTDYFYPDMGGDYDYFDFGDETGHLLEATLGFDGTDNIPVSAFVAMNFFGADAVNKDGDNVMSTYLEAAYNTSAKGIDLSVFAGFALNGGSYEIAGEPQYGFYGNDGFGFVNLGISASREVKITDDYSLPIGTTLMLNPDKKNLNFAFMLSF